MIVALGGNHSRWLGADIEQRQFYRVLDIVFSSCYGLEKAGTMVLRNAFPEGVTLSRSLCCSGLN
ncbi:hypothetical protein [Mycobacterium leprae]|uniref:hypothetical protein n=1 Tax=Mycobacterium leprae TaxID=1769 RepID=UPI00030E8446|nr:hypothetical protein [Mycobacterium leprae]